MVLLDAQGDRSLAVGELSDGAYHGVKRWLQVRALVEEDVSLADGVDLNYEGRRLADALYESRRGGELRKDLVTRALAAAILDGSKHDVKVVDGNEVRGRAPTWPGPAGEMGAD